MDKEEKKVDITKMELIISGIGIVVFLVLTVMNIRGRNEIFGSFSLSAFAALILREGFLIIYKYYDECKEIKEDDPDKKIKEVLLQIYNCTLIKKDILLITLLLYSIILKYLSLNATKIEGVKTWMVQHGFPALLWGAIITISSFEYQKKGSRYIYVLLIAYFYILLWVIFIYLLRLIYNYYYQFRALIENVAEMKIDLERFKRKKNNYIYSIIISSFLTFTQSLCIFFFRFYIIQIIYKGIDLSIILPDIIIENLAYIFPFIFFSYSLIVGLFLNVDMNFLHEFQTKGVKELHPEDIDKMNIMGNDNSATQQIPFSFD